VGTDCVLVTALRKACCDILLAAVGTMPLTANEAAVAFENAGQPVDLFLQTLRTAKQKDLVRSDVAGRLTLTAKGRRRLAIGQSS
jgi:hypothetical protein